jgi:hypothetical protein
LSGVQVTIFLEQDYLRGGLVGNPPKAPLPRAWRDRRGGAAAGAVAQDETDLAIGREILAALLRSDIEVKGDYNPKIFYQKFVLRDYDSTASSTSASSSRATASPRCPRPGGRTRPGRRGRRDDASDVGSAR